MRSRIYEIVDADGDKYFCDNPDCGSNFMVAWDPDGILYCNACLTKAPIPSGATIIIRDEFAVVEDKEPLNDN